MKIPFSQLLRPWPTFWLLLGLSFAVTALLPSDGPPPGSEYHLDKMVHFITFACLAAIPLARFNARVPAFVCTGLMPVFGLMLEYMQKDIAGRQFSPEDMVANNLGILLGIAVGIFLRLQRRIFRQQGGRP